jgi:hypothetical protein
MTATTTNNPRKRIHVLSLVISAVALTIIALFLMPWVNDKNTGNKDRILAGIDVSAGSTFLTEDKFPSGLLFISPLVAVGFIYEYYRKVRSPLRPRRRLNYAFMTLIGIGAFLIWAWLFADAASDCFRAGQSQCQALIPEQANYSAQDVIVNFYTFYLWLYLGLNLLLVALPFWDSRPEEPRKDIAPQR